MSEYSTGKNNVYIERDGTIVMNNPTHELTKKDFEIVVEEIDRIINKMQADQTRKSEILEIRVR